MLVGSLNLKGLTERGMSKSNLYPVDCGSTHSDTQPYNNVTKLITKLAAVGFGP